MKNLFDWLKEINQYKSDSDSFTNRDWDLFNSYMIHRFMSMDRNFIELSNIAQTFPPDNKKQIYEFYKEYVPKNKRFNRYIKAKSTPPSDILLENIAEHYEISKKEAIDYVNMLGINEVNRILQQRGLEEKQIKKIL